MDPRAIQRALPASILVIAITSVPVLVLSPEGLPRVRAQEAELRAVTQEVEAAQRQILLLRKRVAEIKDNPSAIQHIARDELGLVRPDEVVFQFPKPR